MKATISKELMDSAVRIGKAAWENRRPHPGLYFKPYHPWLRRWHIRTLCELVLLEESVLDIRTMNNGLNPLAGFHAERGLIELDMPPWGFFGLSFDVTQYMGTRIRQYS